MFCVCRNGWYHFKLRIPCDLADIVGRSVIQCPLSLRKKREANKMALELRDRRPLETPHAIFLPATDWWNLSPTAA